MADYTNLKEKIERGEWFFDLQNGDYHNHTWYSDGTKSPAGVIGHAKELGLREGQRQGVRSLATRPGEGNHPVERDRRERRGVP